MARKPSSVRRVELALSPSDMRAVGYALSHLEAILADFPERGSGHGYDAITVRDMHKGVQIIRSIIAGPASVTPTSKHAGE